jgi:hypothetical protein
MVRSALHGITGLLLLAVSGSSWAAGQTQISKELVWSRPESEISSPQFSADGNFIVLVTRVHWPDGAEAEGLPDSFFEKLEQRKRKDPRFADPVIRLIDLKGNQTCEIRYGSSPSVSPDNKSIVFSRQKNPISGLRPLAETLAGNDVQLFDCATNQARTIAQPDTGYLDDPLFLSDGKSIAYTQNEAVNGAMGGPVSVELADLTGTHVDTLLAKETTPAVPCPPTGSPESNREAFLCSQRIKLSTSFPNLLVHFAMADGGLLVLQGKPVPSPGDMYLASHYTMNLVSVFPEKSLVFSMGQVKMGNWEVALQSASGGRVMIFSQYWKPFSLQTRDWLPDMGPRNTDQRSVYSPDLRYYLAAEPATEEPNHVTLYDAATGKPVFTSAKTEAVYDITWSGDSKRFAVVVVPRHANAAAYREELVVYSIP